MSITSQFSSYKSKLAGASMLVAVGGLVSGCAGGDVKPSVTPYQICNPDQPTQCKTVYRVAGDLTHAGYDMDEDGNIVQGVSTSAAFFNIAGPITSLINTGVSTAITGGGSTIVNNVSAIAKQTQTQKSTNDNTIINKNINLNTNINPNINTNGNTNGGIPMSENQSHFNRAATRLLAAIQPARHKMAHVAWQALSITAGAHSPRMVG